LEKDPCLTLSSSCNDVIAGSSHHLVTVGELLGREVSLEAVVVVAVVAMVGVVVGDGVNWNSDLTVAKIDNGFRKKNGFHDSLDMCEFLFYEEACLK